VPDIDDDAECRARTGIGGPGFGTRRMRSGTGERSRNPQDAQQPQHDRGSPICPLASHAQNMARSMAGEAIAVNGSSRECPL
jgi:hypothetical protein